MWAWCCGTSGDHDLSTVEVTEAATDRYNAMIDGGLAGSVWNAGGCSSWYIDASGRNSVMWPGYTSEYRKLMSHFDPDDHVCTGSPVGSLTASHTDTPTDAADHLQRQTLLQ